MEPAKLLGTLLVMLVLSSRTDAVPTTEIQPEPDYNGLEVIVLHEEENATVSFTCVSFQDDQLRNTIWFVQRAEDTDKISIPLNSTQFVRSGPENRNFTIVNITQDLDRARVFCGPGEGINEPRFLLGFGGD